LERGAIKDGETTWFPHGYYTQIQQLMQAYLDTRVRNSNKALPKALSDAVHDIRRTVKDLEESLTVKV
jgi:hypothetical protein